MLVICASTLYHHLSGHLVEITADEISSQPSQFQFLFYTLCHTFINGSILTDHQAICIPVYLNHFTAKCHQGALIWLQFESIYPKIVSSVSQNPWAVILFHKWDIICWLLFFKHSWHKCSSWFVFMSLSRVWSKHCSLVNHCHNGK